MHDMCLHKTKILNFILNVNCNLLKTHSILSTLLFSEFGILLRTVFLSSIQRFNLELSRKRKWKVILYFTAKYTFIKLN